MKKFFFVISLLVSIAVGSWFGFLWKKDTIPAQAQLVTEISQNQRVETIREEVGIPKRLEIRTLGVDAPIEEVGLDSKNRMDVPKNVYNTGWYKLGVKPGEPGGALIDGHYDDPQGNPSVFNKLHTMKKGEKITVYDEFDKPLVFTVQEVNTYTFDKVPMGSLIAPSSQKWVHLITCAGEWDKGQKNYTDRIVVSAVMEE